MQRQPAILLLGPTGAGKTPFGDYLAARGLSGRRCVHVDFGANLRAIDSGSWCPETLTADDTAVVHAALTSGALLENEHFHVAEAVLLAVAARESVAADDLLIMNGLPRHLGQAADVDRLVAMRSVVLLDCPPDVVHERIRCDSGGDRVERPDDSLAEVRNKLRIFAERTVPLLDHYRGLGVRVVSVPVGVMTHPADLAAHIEAALTE